MNAAIGYHFYFLRLFHFSIRFFRFWFAFFLVAPPFLAIILEEGGGTRYFTQKWALSTLCVWACVGAFSSLPGGDSVRVAFSCCYFSFLESWPNSKAEKSSSENSFYLAFTGCLNGTQKTPFFVHLMPLKPSSVEAAKWFHWSKFATLFFPLFRFNGKKFCLSPYLVTEK